MATGTADSRATHEDDRQTVQVIERQLGRARFHVKIVDLLSTAALLVVGVLAYLLVIAVIDHWVWSLGYFGRTVAFAGLLVGLAWFAVRFLGPLILRGINPTYAARTIEEAQPSLKNSLINFLLLRQDRGGVREAVFEAVEQKAASDIAAVHVEAAVDRSPMIRVGYVLVGVLALCAAYKILSPKDPFRTAARVVMPWAEISRPSRVQILEVKPGSTKVYHGHSVPVTAVIEGVGDGDPVRLIYSTADGQTVDGEIRMQPQPGGIHFQATLPPEDPRAGAGKSGLRQDVTYRVEAGDAASADYRLSVVAAPTIVVQKLEYEFPAYTKKPPQTVEQGDIQAIEGTKVTIHAQANQPIQSAYIELDPDQSPRGAAEIVPLQFDGQHAWGTIILELAPDRVTSWHTSYQVRFLNAEGEKSEQPIRHQIDVQRDLPPEVQILAPTQRRVEVPENGGLEIEVRGIDPDFGLTRLAVHGETQAKKFDEELLKQGTEPPPQAVAKYTFRPQQHGLKAGDEVQYWGIAADTRQNPKTGAADPNVATTSPNVIVIVAPQEGAQGERSEQPQNGDMPPPDGSKEPRAGADKPPMPSNDKPENSQDDKQPKEGEKSQQPKEGEKSQSKEGSQQETKNSQGEESKGGKGQKGEQSGSKSGSKSQSGGAGQNSKEQSGEQTGQEGSKGGTKGESRSGSKSGEKSSGSPEQESPTDGSAGESSTGSPMGSSGQNSRERAGNEAGRTDEAGDSTSTSEQPAKPAHEGEAIEEILKHRQEKELQSGQPGSQRDGQSPQEGAEGARPGQESQQPQAGDSKNGKSEGAKGQKGTDKGQEKTDGAKGEGAAAEKSDDSDKQPDQQGAKGSKSGEQGKGSKSGQQGTPGADKKNGEGPEKTDAAGDKGGQPQGPMQTEKTGQPQPGAGEKKEPGMGKKGESGAGTSGKEKTGSGESQGEGKGRKKEMSPDSTRPEESETSPPAGSKRQSDSQGDESGDKSGGGKQGAGQPSKQAGNDTDGSNSPADEGAGAAGEKGKGPTGDKGGSQQKAEGKTGAQGSEKGEGTGSKAGQGTDAGGDRPPGQKQPEGKADGSRDSKKGSAGPVLGGGDPNRPDVEYGAKGEVPDGEEANLEYAKKQTELALEYLRDQQDEPDPELLDRLGWSKEEMQEFLRRWEALQKAAQEDPKASHELDESLKSLGLSPARNRKRTGGAASDNTRDLQDSGTRTSAPKSYRQQFDNFRKGSR